jgi:general secretion pathway protein I
MMIARIVGWAKRPKRSGGRVPTWFVSPNTPQRRARPRITEPSGVDARGNQKSRAGFTLVEIIVALAILALSLNAILPAISDALWRTSEAEAQAEAASLARSLLAQAGSAVPLNNGAATGRFGNGFRWRLQVTPYGGADQGAAVRGYKVMAEVSWDDARSERSVALTTLRLGADGGGR